jgi:F-type H+-transporting ATPase subunit epsilon
MAEGKLELEIVTPKGLALRVTVDEVTAPSVEGEFGVMPGHVPLLAALRTGLISYRQGPTTTKCAVGDGFAEANFERVLILTDEFVAKDSIDPVKLRKELTEAESAFAKASTKDIVLGEGDDERKLLARRLNWLAAQLELCGDAPTATVRLLEEARQAVVDDAKVADEAAEPSR